MLKQIMKLVRENPRTVKDMSCATGLSKHEVLKHLSSLPVDAIRTVSHGNRSRPVVVIHYLAK